MTSTEKPLNRTELLELYKLHAELADRVSERRGGANRLYASLLSGAAVFATAIIRFGNDNVDSEFVSVIGFLGCCLSLSWIFVIRAYRQLNTAKFVVLSEIEEHLSYQFFREEWDVFLKRKTNSIGLTFTEVLLPLIYAGFFIYVFRYGFVLCSR